MKCVNKIYSLINPIISAEFQRLRDDNPNRSENRYLIGHDLVALLDKAGVFADLNMSPRTKLGMILRAVKQNPECADVIKKQIPVVDVKGKKTQPAIYRLMTHAEIKQAINDDQNDDQDDLQKAKKKNKVKKPSGTVKVVRPVEKEEIEALFKMLLKKKGIIQSSRGGIGT